MRVISLRRRMLYILLSAFFIVWFVATGVTISNTAARIREGIDNQLVAASDTLYQQAKQAIGDDAAMENLGDDVRIFGRVDTSLYQVWYGDNLIKKSDNAPTHRMSNRPGFQAGDLNDIRWRFYYRVDAVRGLDVIIAFKDDFSGDVADQIGRATTYPMLLALPFIGIAIYLGVTRGLKPLRALESQITARTPTQMDPIDADQVPHEVRGIVRSLNGLLERLQIAIEGERRFTSNASHELRTPLAAIEVQTQVALRATDHEERKKALNQISHSVDRATRMVSQLLTMARIDPDGAESMLHQLDLRRVVEEEVAEISQTALDKQIDIGMDAPESALIDGDPDALSILTRNLLDNAIRYTPEGGQVTAAIRQAGGHVFLSVIDTGPGISDEEKVKVYDRFYRIVGSTSSGAGLGLSIVKRIAELHQADLRLSDNPDGQGLVISVAFKESV